MPKSPVILEFVAERSALLTFLGAASRIANGKPIPVYGFALLSDGPDGVTWWACNGDLYRSDRFEAAIAQSGEGLLPVRQTLELLRRCEDGPVRLAFTDTNITVSSGQLTAKWQTLPVIDFPVRPSPPAQGVRMPAVSLAHLLTRVLPAVNQNGAKYFMRGALLQVTPEAMTFVSTDGYQIARAVAETVSAGEAFEAIVPRTAMEEISTMLNDTGAADVTYAHSGPHHFFLAGTSVLVSRAIDDKFAAYERIIPKTHNTRIVCGREAFAAVVRRVMLASDLETRRIRFALDGQSLRCSASSPVNGETLEAFPATHDGPEDVFAIKGQYVLNFLEAATAETITCDLLDKLSPVVFSSKDDGDVAYTYVIGQIRDTP